MMQRTKAALGSLAVAASLFFSGSAAQAEPYWQCVTFARMFSGIQIFGDAWTWWGSALKANYPTGFQPKSGAVLVFRPEGKMSRGHVAVVSQVLTDRVVQITHANWSIMGGRRGQVEKDVTVVDVSPRGDWSQVKVWYDPIRDLGTTSYPTYGFIYQKTDGAARNAMQTAAMSAVSQVAAAVQAPAAAPVQSIARNAAEQTDRIAALITNLTSGDSEAR
jgi:surface antigen